MKWLKEELLNEHVQAREFRLAVQGRDVPGMLWLPVGQDKPTALVLYAHGGSQHKTAPSVLEQAARFVGGYGFAMASIDGPVHGDRRSDRDAQPMDVQRDFAQMWAVNPQYDAMVADWRATLDALLGLPFIDANRVGWCGLSMGTAYGVPLLATEARVKAAVLGMWGSDFMHGERLVADAPAVQCPTLFQIKWEDQFFPRQGQLDLFDRLGAAEKACKIYMGGHVPVMGPQQKDLEAFLAEQLA